MPARPSAVDGVLLYDKPAGITSHDVVYRVRRAHDRAKTGHAGTLDPFATGLLLILVGRATRAQQFLMGLPKSYETVARLGATSTTGDTEGEIVVTGRIPPDPPDLPTGEVVQTPPAYSAIKIGGERAYAKARRGETVEIPQRTVTVMRFEQLWRREDRAAFAIDCSSGTYIRSLVMDLGDAYCEELRRTSIGPFDVADADPERLLPLGDVLRRILPEVPLDPERARRAGHGVAVAGEAPDGAAHVVLTDEDGPIAVAQPREGGLLKPTVGFRA